MWTASSVPYLTPRKAGQADAWSEEAAATGRTGGQRLLEVEHARPPARVAEGLRLDPGSMAVLRRRLILLDDDPVEIADSWYPASIAEGTALERPGKIPGGAVTLLAELGYVVREADEDICVRGASAEEALHLGIDEGDPVLQLVRVSFADGDVPFEVADMVMTTGRHLSYRLRVS